MYAGARCGDYVLERLLHQGGRFNYWLARDRAGDRFVAALLHPGQVYDDVIAQVHEGLRDRAAIRHPRIPRLIDIIQGDTVAAVYEHVQGVSVQTIMEAAGGRLPETVAARIVERIARTLHEARVPPRWCSTNGLEPSNILIDPSGAPHFLLSPPYEAPSNVTGPGVIAGAILYMSPEAIMATPLLPQSIVFSLGVLFYELLAGRHPFRDEGSLIQGLHRILNDEREPISSYAEVSPEVERVLDRAMSRAAEDRQLHAGELADALHAALPADANERAVRDFAVQHVQDLDDPEFEQRDTSPVAPADEETELRAAILADREAIDPYLVYADWLQSRGRARGELIVLQHQQHEAEQEFLAQHPELVGELLPLLERPQPKGFPAFAAGPHFLGDLSRGPLSARWHLGFIESIRVSLEGDLSGSRKIENLFRMFDTNEATQFLRGLSIGPVDDQTYHAFAAARMELESLFVGDLSAAPPRVQHRSAASISSAFPSLKRLAIRGASIHLGRLMLPALRELRIYSAGLDAETINHIASSVIPKLTHLELWFGGPPARSAWPDRVGLLFQDRHLPSLESLALGDREPQAIAATLAVLAESDLAKRLVRLDLSESAIAEAAARGLLQNKDRFPRLLEVRYSSQNRRSGPTSSIG